MGYTDVAWLEISLQFQQFNWLSDLWKSKRIEIIGSIYIHKLRKNFKGGWWVLHPTICMDGEAGALHSPDRCANLLGGIAQFRVFMGVYAPQYKVMHKYDL